MTAGTVVITGGILATVILLCIIVVLCYCRLQYYCCKKNGSYPDSSSCSQAQLACDSCPTSSGLDGACVTPLSLSPELAPGPRFCPTCSPYSSSFYVPTAEETRNGGQRATFAPSRHDSPALSLTLPFTHTASLSPRTLPDFYCNTRAISTDV